MKEAKMAQDLVFIDGERVHRLLDYPACIAAIEAAMRALSGGATRQLPRTMIHMGEGRTFAQMTASLADDGMFGAKLISVFADPARPGQRSHRGVITLFEPAQGHPVAVVDAEAVTHIRTAAATAVATRALARADARALLIMGTGGQAHTHLAALPLVHRFERILIWGRDPARAAAVVQQWQDRLPVAVAPDAQAAVAQADVICTVSGAAQPILLGQWVRPGTHVNLVGSSAPGPVEADTALVAAARYIADSKANAREAAAEFLVARAAGVVNDAHIVAEIGEVLLGQVPGRRDARDITLYKSLGHAVQDIAAAQLLLERVRAG
ncbi:MULTISPECIES: ornithine cyclodeaminase family protein [unclassified Novosphingobium]|uniref:ornithine cyclodeaminase family protein n=2 Tax=Novosphingobium TaxID=165696 RepID=UPI0014412431|nr:MULTISPECIES: ornithine cyclodeaminase family protein [unclassified Novosphingobium]MBB3653588.1 ornithine cyclodeaminase [Novosphingobium sp. BK626]MBB3359406.1 ornithine cyclodeaminase [Novosphingobium sp. BK256]MBB3375766.1 ornithine cyclodeaminase [Novosphingobium sp. BK280]MBB3380179.1 ornithine cyclodeaminase [Novosphingobium sp. BK258]MBB3421873.1 ornithine cyclodeaminase [Novosphingobium sp. BK267]